MGAGIMKLNRCVRMIRKRVSLSLHPSVPLPYRPEFTIIRTHEFHYPCTPPFRYRTDRSLRSSVHTSFIIPAPLRSVTVQTGVYDHPKLTSFGLRSRATPPFRYRTDRSLRSSVHTRFIIPAPLRSVTAQTGVYDHPYTRVSLSLHPSVPLPYRPEFNQPYTRVFIIPAPLRSVTVQTGVYDHPYTRVSLSLQSFRYRTYRSLRSSVHTRFIIPGPFRYRTDRSLRSSVHTSFIIPANSVPLPYNRSLRSSVHTSFIIPAPIRSVTVQTGVYDHPYTRVSLSLHPSVPLPYRPEFTINRTHEFHYPCTHPFRYRRPEFTIIRTHEFHYPCTHPFRYRTDRSLRSSVHTSFIIPAPIRSVTVQTRDYDHPYTRVVRMIPVPSVPLPYRPEFTIIRTHEFHYPCTHPFRYRTDRSLRSSVHTSFIIPAPFRYRTDRSLRSSVHTSFIIAANSVPLPYRPEFTINVHTSFIIPAPIRSVTVQTGVYDHPYTRVSLSLHPSVPLPYRPEFTIIRTHEFHYPCTLRSVTVQTGVYDHPYTRVSLSLHPSVPLPYRPEFTIIRTPYTRPLRYRRITIHCIHPSVPLPYRPEFTIIRTHEFHYPCTHPFRYRTDRSLGIIRTHECTDDRKLRSVR